jgi:hypothetical protein
MKRKYYLPYLVIGCILFAQTACEKDFLEKKPNSGIVVPKTLDDFQKIMDNFYVINVTPALGFLSTDDSYFLNDQAWQSSIPTERNAYIWAQDIYEGGRNIEDWNGLYKSIFYSNVMLEGVKQAEADKTYTSDWDQIKGGALFTRAFANFGLLDCFAMPYDNQTAKDDLGIPIRLNSNIDQLVQRSSVATGYNQVIDDLQRSLLLLTSVLPQNNRNRPWKAGAYALLARVYLSMRNYDKVELYTDSALALQNKLIDYNTISTTSTTPFTINNDEVIVRYTAVNAYPTLSITATTTLIDSNLIKEYNVNDLRKAVYFRTITGGFGQKRGYIGPGVVPFTGLATDELYLVKAECLARRTQVPQAMSLLNTLLVKRYKTNTFVALTANTSAEALALIYKERRKELVFRGARWSDLRRLNKEGANITLTRTVNGITYTLLPNSPRYAMPIPGDEIAVSGIQQNIR